MIWLDRAGLCDTGAGMPNNASWMITNGDSVLIRDGGVVVYEGSVSQAPPEIVELMKEFTEEPIWK